MPTPDISISIERVGGGAAAEGFAAFTASNVPLAEDWTEESCLRRVLYMLFAYQVMPNFPPPAHIFPRNFITLHDIEDCCRWVDSGALLS